MFKDFSQFNSEQSKVLQPKSVLALSDAIRVQSSLLSSLQNVVSRYTRAYNSVQVIKYDENGDPVDVTPDEQLTVPANVLSFMKAQIDQVRTQLDEYRDVVSDLTSSISITTAQWQRNLESNYVCLGGHAILIRDLVQGNNIPAVCLMNGATASEGKLFIGVDSARAFCSTLPDAAAEYDGESAYGWISGGVGFVSSSVAIGVVEGDDIYSAFFYNGKIYYYDFTVSLPGRYRGLVENAWTGDLTMDIMFTRALGSNYTTYTSLQLASSGQSAVSGRQYNLSATEMQPTVTEDYQVETPAILLDSIITTDQALADIKATL